MLCAVEQWKHHAIHARMKTHKVDNGNQGKMVPCALVGRDLDFSLSKSRCSLRRLFSSLRILISSFKRRFSVLNALSSDFKAAAVGASGMSKKDA